MVTPENSTSWSQQVQVLTNGQVVNKVTEFFSEKTALADTGSQILSICDSHSTIQIVNPLSC